MSKFESVQYDFPILHQEVNDEPLVYLDNAATTQKPAQVLDALKRYFENDNANVHRGVHTLAERATREYELSREKVRDFLKAKSTKEILFTRGTTTSLNWVMQSYGRANISEGDEIVISKMEHHSNIVPWQQLCKETGATLKYIEVKDGLLDMDSAKSVINEKTKILSIAHVSNVFGCLNPVKELAALVHSFGGVVIVDGAQSAPHIPINVQELNCDFFALSGHKMCAPTGIGVLWGREELLETMEPVEFGGEMIDFVHLDTSTWTELPWKFEAGTPNIAGAIGLGAAIDYLNSFGMVDIHQHTQELIEYVFPKLKAIDGVEIYGSKQAKDHFGVIAFNIEGLHPHDVATALDMEGVAVRAGHHCAQPLIREIAPSTYSTCRASFYFYNTKEDCDRFIQAILATKEFFQDGII